MATTAPHPPASFLTLPTELRNAIYMYIFDADANADADAVAKASPAPSPVAIELHGLTTTSPPSPSSPRDSPARSPPHHQLRLLQTCRQIHAEASLLALAHTTFRVSGESTQPEVFRHRTRHLSRPQLGAIRQVVLTARIGRLRALNEDWLGLPFGHAQLSLELLVVVPTRPAMCATAYAEIADLSQSHTLAYVFCETLKRLRRVRCVEVRNGGCFNEVVWRLVYRSLVYRMWRWGGGKCGLRFESGEVARGGSEREENRWFRVYMPGSAEGSGNEVEEEVVRLVGGSGELPDVSVGDGVFQT